MVLRRTLRTAVLSLSCLSFACGGASSPAASEAKSDPAPPRGEADAPRRPAGDKSSSNEEDAPGKPAPHTEKVLLGRAHFVLGVHPPWSSLDEVKPGRRAGDPPAAPEAEPKAPAQLGSSWRLLRTITVGIGYLSQAELTPDGSEVFVLSDDDGTLRRYEVASGKLIDKYSYPEFQRFDPVAFTLLPSGGKLTEALLSGPRGMGLLDLVERAFAFSGQSATDLRSAGRPGLFGVSLLQTEPQSGFLQLFWYPGPDEGGGTSLFAFEERPDGWSLSSDGTKLAVLYFPSNEIEILDLKERRVLPRIPAPKYAHGLALSPDDRYLAVGGEELWIYDARSGQRVTTETRFDNNIHAVRFTPDGKLLLVSAYDGKARSYAFGEDGKLGARQLLAHRGTANVYALGLNEAGDRLVTSSGDQTIKIWQR